MRRGNHRGEGLPGVYFYAQDGATGGWTYLSKGAEALTGYTPDELRENLPRWGGGSAAARA